MTVLFADLVGFTTLSEHADPEYMRDFLSEYFARCRGTIERYGGTVEKFIGDAVMSVWGSPVAREDDAERAVRAALELTRRVRALGEEEGKPDLRLRVGVLTGPAAVSVGKEGEGMVLGDTVNTASRLQSIAQPGSVLVEDVTRRMSEAAIVYEDAGTHQVKGRQQPVRAWKPLRVVAGVGGARREVGLEAPFVGRDSELQMIIEASEKSVREGATGHVTVIGEAGTGKSRLLWEYFKYVDGIEEGCWWHQGRCLSYGEGVAYSALAEMIRARAGIAEEEHPDSAREKLITMVEQFVHNERELRLIVPRLAHLLGIEEREASDAADLFSGWRMFFERMASTEPVILAFEDLQWATSGLLDFIDYLLEWSAGFPIFVLALARPELEERRPSWGTRARLQALSDAEMQALLEGLAPGLPESLTARILERAEGMPLYAVEIIRMLLDRGLLALEGSRYVARDLAELEIPETLHALAAARLDNLEPPMRTLVQQAAVIGMSFAPEAVAAVSGQAEAKVRETLDAVLAKQVLGRVDDPRLAEHGQYHFLQALLQAVALSTLSHRDRKACHLAAAGYIRSKFAEGEMAEILASHYLAAAQEVPDAPDADEIRASACEALALAGRHSMAMAMPELARRYLEQAAQLSLSSDERARLLAEAGTAAARAYDREGAHGLLEEAITLLSGSAPSEQEQLARTQALVADVLMADDRLEEAAALMDSARASITEETVLAELAARRARVAILAGDYTRALQEAEGALAIAEPRGLVAVLADANLTKAAVLGHQRELSDATAACSLGLALGLDGELIEQALRGYYNLVAFRIGAGYPEEALENAQSGLALARERGDRAWERDLLAQSITVRVHRGEWDEALAEGDALREEAEDSAERVGWGARPLILAARGDRDGLERWLERELPPSEWHEQALDDAVARAAALFAVGRVEQAAEIARPAWAEKQTAGGAGGELYYLGDIVDILLAAGEVALIEDGIAAVSANSMPVSGGQLSWIAGLLHARRGEAAEAHHAFQEAVEKLRGVDQPFALARAQLDLGNHLAQTGNPADAEQALGEARTLFAQLRATPWLQRAESALAPLAAA
jgi:class 3 adenylate cyclase